MSLRLCEISIYLFGLFTFAKIPDNNISPFDYNDFLKDTFYWQSHKISKFVHFCPTFFCFLTNEFKKSAKVANLEFSKVEVNNYSDLKDFVEFGQCN